MLSGILNLSRVKRYLHIQSMPYKMAGTKNANNDDFNLGSHVEFRIRIYL